MKIFVEISYHGEPPKTYDRMLSSLNSQIGIDWDKFTFIISRSDGGTFFPDLTSYTNLSPRTICISKLFDPQGPSATRQQALDYAQMLSTDPADRFTMVDIDDKLVSNTSLQFLYDTCIYYMNTDMIVFPMKYYSVAVDDFVETSIPPCQHVEPQGKCYRLDFIKKNDFHFPRRSWTYEDSYWQACLYAVGGFSLIWMPEPIYVYTEAETNPASTSLWIRTKMPPEEVLNEWVNRFDEFEEWTRGKGNLNLCEFINVQTCVLVILKDNHDISSPEIHQQYLSCLERLEAYTTTYQNSVKESFDVLTQSKSTILYLKEQ